MSKPLVYNYATAEAKIQKQAEEIIQLKEENTNLRIKCRILEADLDALQGGDAKMNPIPNGTGVMQQIPSEDGSDLINRADVLKYPIRLDHYDEVNGSRVFVYGVESVIEYVESLPSADAVQVVRCKDCKWYKPNQLVPVHPLLGGGIVYENHCDVNIGFAPKENDFCSRAKMKGGADNG